MPAFGDYSRNGILDFFLNAVDLTAPASAYLSLHTAAGASASTAAWAATELTVGGGAVNYSRTAAAPAAWGAAASGSITNTSDITCPAAGSSWGVLTHVAIWDASSAGNMIFYGALSAPRTINNGDTAQFAAGNLVVVLT